MLKRKNKYFILLLIAVFSCSINIHAQDFSKEEQGILKLQDIRSIGNDNDVLKYLKTGNPDVKYRALIALGNIADSSYCNEIGNVLLTSDDTKLKAAACFALGEISSARSTEILLKALGTEKNVYVISAIFDNLGKIGDDKALESVAAYESTNDNVNGAEALSIARFGSRKIKSETAIYKLMTLAAQSYSNDDSKKLFAYALFRAGDKKLLSGAAKVLEALCTSANSETRMWAYSALGKLQDDSYMGFIIDQFKNEKDWRVRVNMLIAAGNLKINSNNFNDTYLDRILNAVTDDLNDNVSIVAAQTTAKLYQNAEKTDPNLKTVREKLEWVLIPNKAIDWQVKAECVKALAKIFKDDYRSTLFGLYSQTDNYDLKAEIIRSFASMNDAMVYKELRDTISADVQRYNKLNPNKDGSMIGSEDLAKVYRAFVDCLSDLGSKLDDENRNNLRLIFSEFMSSRNAAIVDVCLTSLQDSIYLKYRDETGKIMMFDFPDLSLPKDADVMQLYIQAMGNMKIKESVDLLKKNLASDNYDIAKASADALKNITGKDYEPQIKATKYKTDFDWDFIHRFADFKTATIHTSAGNIKILLFYKDAPFTCMSFVKLAQKHFYDNIIFHRVVPNFVIQGGDPTGTGYGGPGYSIRSEFTPMSFETGYVGMASGGKDTEGSQFFITHSPQYHLDGKYTIFAKVTEGMETVDKIQIGDKIESITFSSE